MIADTVILGLEQIAEDLDAEAAKIRRELPADAWFRAEGEQDRRVVDERHLRRASARVRGVAMELCRRWPSSCAA